MAEDDKVDKAEAPKGKSKMLILIIAAVVVLAAIFFCLPQKKIRLSM